MGHLSVKLAHLSALVAILSVMVAHLFVITAHLLKRSSHLSALVGHLFVITPHLSVIVPHRIVITGHVFMYSAWWLYYRQGREIWLLCCHSLHSFNCFVSAYVSHFYSQRLFVADNFAVPKDF